jgi:hypothetical protein
MPWYRGHRLEHRGVADAAGGRAQLLLDHARSSGGVVGIGGRYGGAGGCREQRRK